MREKKKIPKRLYKYRKFNVHTLDMIVNDMVFYANPSDFNDPLDTSPSLKVDLDEGRLTTLLRRIVEQRIRSELTSKSRSIGDNRSSTQKGIQRRAQRQALELINYIDFAASNPDFPDDEGPGYDTVARRKTAYRRNQIEIELQEQYDKGIVSLATKATCPLMWSHYSDHHRGICIVYSVRNEAICNLHKVKYGSSRLVQASDVSAMLDGDNVARVKVDEAVLLQKAVGWQYEEEWRLIGSRGNEHSPLEMEEIIFGMRCNETVMYAVMETLKDREPQVDFYEMCVERGTFNLEKQPLDFGGLRFLGMPRRSPISTGPMFEPVD